MSVVDINSPNSETWPDEGGNLLKREKEKVWRLKHQQSPEGLCNRKYRNALLPKCCLCPEALPQKSFPFLIIQFRHNEADS